MGLETKEPPALEYPLYFTFHDQNIKVTIPTQDALEAEVKRRLTAREGFALATINLDHLVKLRDSPSFAQVYALQDLVVADGWPVVTLSRLAGRPVELLPGSDLVLPLCQWAAASAVTLGLLGSTTQTLEAAKAVLESRVPGLDVVYMHAPPMGFDPAGEVAASELKKMQAKGIGLCLLALGAPKQEELAARGRGLAPSVGFVSVGAGLDFLSGRQRRAPMWVRRLRLEWLWRALSSPRRLIPRYAKCLAILPGEAVKALRQRG